MGVFCLGQGCRGGRVRFDAMGDKTNVVQRKRVGVKEVGLSLHDQERTTVLYGMRVCVSVKEEERKISIRCYLMMILMKGPRVI